MEGRSRIARVVLVLLLSVGKLAAQGVRATVHGSIYLRQQVVAVPVIEGELGDVAFDPTGGNSLYLLIDDTIEYGGGAWRLDDVDGMLVRGEPIAAADRPSGIAFTPEGDLWILRDLLAAEGHLLRIPTPRSGPPYSTEVVITGFQTDLDDDPKALAVAPPAFAGTNVRPGDILIGEAGADTDTINAIYALSPSAPTRPTDAYDLFLVPPGGFAGFDDQNLIDFDFSQAGDALFVLFLTGDVVAVNAEGTVGAPLATGGLDTRSARALAVNPRDGRVWLGREATGEVWSFDPGGEPTASEPRLEIAFTRTSESWPLAAIHFHSPSLRFSPDGQRLAVTDTQGLLWVFDAVETQDNRPPTADIRYDVPGQVLPMLGDLATFELDGTGSSDGDGGTQPLSHSWSQVSGPAPVEIEDPSAPMTTVTFTEAGIYILALRVDDGQARDSTATAQIALGVLAFEASHGETFAGFQLLPLGGVAGDVAFAPGAEAGSGFFALLDDLPAQGGGAYEIVQEAGRYRRGRKLAELDRPSSLAFTPDGDLWIARDYSAANGPYLSVLRRPLEDPLAALEPAIVQLGGAGDDDPGALAVVPPGFGSGVAASGDLLILDYGADGSDPVAIYAYSPAAPRGDPAAYSVLLATTAQLSGLAGFDATDLAFSRDGARLFVGVTGQGIVEIDAGGNIVGPLATGSATFWNPAGLAVDPGTGRLWVADQGSHQVWSVDLETGEAAAEIQLSVVLPELGVLPIDLHVPSLAFSPDGQRLVVSDASNRGWLWVFEKPGEPPSPPRFRRGDADGDGTVDISDPIQVLGYLFLGTEAPECLDAPDADDNGAVDISDAVYALGYLFLGTRAPPAPGPDDCGADPTEDALGSCEGLQAGC